MTAQTSDNGVSRAGTVFFVICFVLVLYGTFLVFRPFFTILVWAGVLTVVFLPLFDRLLRVLKGRRTLAAFLSCIIVLLLIILPVTLLVAGITSQSIALYHSIQDNLGTAGSGDATSQLGLLQSRPAVRWVLDQASRWMGTPNVDLEGVGRQVISAVSRWVVSEGPKLLAGVGGMLSNFLLVFISMFFLFRDGPALMEEIRSSSPLPEEYEREIKRKFQDVSYATFYGSILTAIVQGAAAAILFWFISVPSPLFWGAVVSFVSLVPIVGAFLVWIPMSGYFFLQGQSSRAIILLVIGGLVVSSIDNILKPLIIRGRTDMHPLLLFLSVLGGMQIFGFLGVLLGPLMVAILLSFLSFYRLEFSHALKHKKLV